MGTQKGEARHCQAPPGLVRLPPNCHALVLLRAKLISAAKVSPAGNRPCSTIVNGGTGAGAEWHSKAEGTPQIEAVRIFGSRAKETARRDSDLDLAITASNGNYVALADRLEAHYKHQAKRRTAERNENQRGGGGGIYPWRRYYTPPGLA
jgi:Polymerase beta, Nucleotidyltransferase